MFTAFLIFVLPYVVAGMLLELAVTLALFGHWGWAAVPLVLGVIVAAVAALFHLNFNSLG
jgi:hypothetical protein